MEKRIFVAFLLSFMFLALWAKISPPPAGVKKPAPQEAVPQSRQSPPPVLKEETVFSVEKIPIVEEKTQVLENSKLHVEFTNIGGTIKKIVINQYGTTLPVTNIMTVDGFAEKEFTLEQVSQNSIVYIYRQDESEIRKTYTLSWDDYLIDAKAETANKLEINMYTLDISRLDKINERDKSLLEYSIALPDKIFRKGNAFRFDQKESRSEQVQAIWYGYRDKYFSFVIRPEQASSGYQVIVSNDKHISFKDVPRETSAVTEYRSSIYFGPQQPEIMTKYGKSFEKIIAYSNWGIIDGIAKIVYSMLIWIQRIIHSWGLSIIVIGALIYLMTYPLTMAGMSSMKKMQSLQPQMTKLREQHKSNPQKLNQEMMELYKKHKVNPMGGCLPMIMQMPIFIGLYQILWRSVVLKGKSFLWIKDLSEPDRIIVFNQSMPLIGNEFNILPVLMGIVMFFQQKLSMKTMAGADPAQQSQQKMMLMMLPVMMLFIFYKAASGLTLYFTVLYLLTTFTQWKIAKKVKVE